MSEIKSYLIVLLAVFIVALSTCNGCRSARIAKLENELSECKAKAPAAIAPTVFIKHDTVPVLIPVNENVLTRPSPQDGVVLKKVFIPVHDTVTTYSCVDNYAGLVLRYNELLGQYRWQRTFSDTVRIKGVVLHHKAYVSENTLDSLQTTLDSLPKLYVTNTVYKQRRPTTKGYITLTGQGSRYDPLQSFGGGFMLQFKTGNAVEGSVFYSLKTPTPDWSHTTFQVSYKHFITFRKF